MTIEYDEAYVQSEVEHAKQLAKARVVNYLLEYASKRDTILGSKQLPEDVREKAHITIMAIDLLSDDLLAWAQDTSNRSESHDYN